jgi:transcriptional regulator with XRE-family HTH domain
MAATVAMTPGFEEAPVARTAKKPAPASEETFGRRLARLRKARGYTQTELGEILGVSQRVMTYYERETERPPAHLLTRMAEVLGVRTDELLGLEAPKIPAAIKNRRLLRRLQELDRLPKRDQQALLRTIDAFLLAKAK